MSVLRAIHIKRSDAMIIPGLLKLGTLAIRTISKPIAGRLKRHAGLHPMFREFIISIAQANHRLSTTIQRRIYGRATDVLIRPLNEEKAVQAAADLLGEAFLFTVAGALIIYEVQRSMRSEARKEEKRKQEIEALKQREGSLQKEVELLKLKLQLMEQFSARRSTSDFVSFWQAQTPREHKMGIPICDMRPATHPAADQK